MEPMWQVPARVRLELLALLSADATKPATMTYDEFIAWVDEDTLAEWADGRVVMARACYELPLSLKQPFRPK